LAPGVEFSAVSYQPSVKTTGHFVVIAVVQLLVDDYPLSLGRGLLLNGSGIAPT